MELYDTTRLDKTRHDVLVFSESSLPVPHGDFCDTETREVHGALRHVPGGAAHGDPQAGARVAAVLLGLGDAVAKSQWRRAVGVEAGSEFPLRRPCVLKYREAPPTVSSLGGQLTTATR